MALTLTNQIRFQLHSKTLQKGPVVDKFKEMVEAMFKGAATAKGALVITPEKIIVTTPGADNKKELLKKPKQTRSFRSVSDSVKRSRCVLFAFI